MIYAVLSFFIIAILAPVLNRLFKNFTGLILSVLPLSVTVFFIIRYWQSIINNYVFSIEYNWVNSLNVPLMFYVDGLSLLFALLICFFGFLIVLYSSSYLKGHKHIGRFYCYLLLFMGSMVGVVLSGNLISMFIFWEMTSVTSYLLIAFNNNSADSRRASLQALLVTGMGGLALLGGFILLGYIGGSYDISILLKGGLDISGNALYNFMLILILIGAFTKSAQFPFHFWLPNAMEAPTPVSAYLHSATMVKLGVFLLMRLSPITGGTVEWKFLLITFGIITMIFGAVMAIQKSDLKAILAYTTISALGILVFLTGIGTEVAVKASVVFLISHALYKATLFLTAGNIDHETGTRNIKSLGGLFKSMPVTSAAILMASLSMAGLPPFLGFISKELFYEAAFSIDKTAYLPLFAAFISSALFVVIAIILGYKITFGKTNETPKKPHEAPFLMLTGPLILSFTGLIMGIFPFISENILFQAARSISTDTPKFYLSLWHGFNFVLFLSILTLIIGYFLFKTRSKVKEFIKTGRIFNFDRTYDNSLAFIRWFSTEQTRIFQTGFLRQYIINIILVFVILTFYIILIRHNLFAYINITVSEWNIYEVLAVMIIFAASYITLTARSRLTALVNLGVIGFGLALIFIFFGAPDLAMTIFLVETLTVVLFVLILHKLPRFKVFERRVIRWRYLALSSVFGLIMTLILLIITGFPLDSHLKQYYAENAVLLGKGRNIVNVILVDFRALDTFGEIIVLGIGALGIYSLIHLSVKNKNAE